MAIRLVLTGGPCAGKSTALSIVEQRLTSLGYKVIILDEAATSCMKSGMFQSDLGQGFQQLLFEFQLYRDRAYNKQIEKLEKQGKKVILLYDRGILDGMAYSTKDKFLDMLKHENLQEYSLMTSYDAVFHLVTAADGAVEYYTKANNSVRLENATEAIDVDRRTLRAWVGHPHLKVIDNNCVGFEQKMNKLMKEILSFLGEPEPLEKERKFLIRIPDLNELVFKFGANKTSILQTYLIEVDSGVERRIRQRGTVENGTGDYQYYYTEKYDISHGTRGERERRISSSEYQNYLMEADTKLKPIRKDRYSFVYQGRYFELDVYPFWDNQAILEIEVEDINEVIDMPDFIKVVSDVTDDIRYKNHSLAKSTDV